jgi:hypothetical protein
VTVRVNVMPPSTVILKMKTTLKLKINLMGQYLGLLIYPTKPSADFPNPVRLFL